MLDGSARPAVHDLLLISDLHLGSHLKPRMRGEFVHLASRIEEIFPRFLGHYRRAGRWQLVINGDFIDFWNVVLPEAGREDGERLAIRRLHAVFDAHPAVEDALARFLAAGNGIVFVAGNHDAELLYGGVRAAIVERLQGAMGGPADLEELGITTTGSVRLDELPPGRIRFVRWFLREEGGAWIEHGHTFDPSCATPAPLSPTRGGKLVQTVAEVATRSFANVMPEIDYEAPDKFTAMDYIRWAVARGWRFVIRVVLLYLRTSGLILALWAKGRVDRHGHRTHQERLAAVAENAGLQMSALAALEKMAPPPSATTVAGLFRVMALDLATAMFAPLAIAAVVAITTRAPVWACVVAGVAASGLSLFGLNRGRPQRNIARDMLEVAASVGDVTGVPLVLMGHSHRGTLERLGDVVYANSGSWLDGSHLVVRREQAHGRLVEVELRKWRNDGVAVLQTMDVPNRAAETVADTWCAEPGDDDARAPVPS